MSSNGFTVIYDRVENQLRTSCRIHSAQTIGADTFTAVWDTGAKITTISSRLAAQLALSKAKEYQTHTVGGIIKQSSYLIDLELTSYIKIANLEVLAGELNGFDVLIGMDIISLGDFAVSNANGHTTLTFRIPPVEPIDFCNANNCTPPRKRLWNWLWKHKK